MNKRVIIFSLIGILLVVVIVVTVVVKKRNKNNPTQQSTGQSNNPDAQDSDSDFTGRTNSCTPVDDNQWYRSDHTLAVDPINTENLSLFIEKRGFFTTADTGATWEYRSKGIKGFASDDNYKQRPCYLEFQSTAVDKTNPNRILIGALGDFNTITSDLNKAGGLLETTDKGKTWRQLLTPEVNAYVHSIAIHPTDPQTIYYVTSSQTASGKSTSLLTKGLVYKTVDGGKKWEELSTDLLPNTGAQEIFIDAANPDRLMVTTVTFNYVNGKRVASAETLGILRSDDGGKTWQRHNSLPKGDEAISTSANSPTQFNNLYVSVMSDNGARSYYSTDAAQSFKKSGMAMDVVAYDPTDTSGKKMFGYAWQSISGRTMFKSSDAGATWQATGTLPSDITTIQDPKQRISKIVFDPKNVNTIYMAGAGAKVWKSTDAGSTWATVLTLDTLP